MAGRLCVAAWRELEAVPAAEDGDEGRHPPVADREPPANGLDGVGHRPGRGGARGERAPGLGAPRGSASGSHDREHASDGAARQEEKATCDYQYTLTRANRSAMLEDMTYRETALTAVRTAATKAAIMDALTVEGGHVARTAARLGLSRSALYRAAKACGLTLHVEADRLRPA